MPGCCSRAVVRRVHARVSLASVSCPALATPQISIELQNYISDGCDDVDSVAPSIYPADPQSSFSPLPPDRTRQPRHSTAASERDGALGDALLAHDSLHRDVHTGRLPDSGPRPDYDSGSNSIVRRFEAGLPDVLTPSKTGAAAATGAGTGYQPPQLVGSRTVAYSEDGVTEEKADG